MPLLDHFQPPLSTQRHWESFQATWAGTIADVLNTELLPEGYFAEEQIHSHHRPDAKVEVEMGSMDNISLGSYGSGNDGMSNTATATQTWAPPVPTMVLPITFPNNFSILVYSTEGGPSLVAAIELVSPFNKERNSQRRAFATKCISYLCQGIGLILIDIVTNRQTNLHNETMRLLGATDPFNQAADTFVYAVAYRPLRRNGKEQIDIWPHSFEPGEPLPVLPLALDNEESLPVDLEGTYMDACRRRRLV